MGRTKNPANKLVTDRYLAATRPFLASEELAKHLDTTIGTVWRWDRGFSTPNERNTHKLGVLAATIMFLRVELSFDVDDTANYLRSISLDPQSYEPVTTLELIKAGETPSVIQRAIELSITDQ